MADDDSDEEQGDFLLYCLRQPENSHDMITTLDLADTSFDPDFDQLDPLMDAILNNKTVSTVEIDGNALVCFTLEQAAQLLESIGRLPKLKSLFVRAFLAPVHLLTGLLQQASGLQKITLDSVNLVGAEAGVDFCVALRQLVSLQDIRFCNMRYRNGFSFDEMMRALAGLPLLSKVEMEVEQGGAVSSEAMGQLCQSTTMRELRMSPIDFTLSHIQSIATALETNACLELLELGLGNGSHTSDTWLAMAKMLQGNTALKSLTMISFDGLDDDACIAMATALEQNTQLQKLSLSRCGLDRVMSTDAAVSFSKMLRTNASLTELSMNSIGIGEQGVLAMAEALEQNASLNILNLQGFGEDVSADGGLQALLEMLQTKNIVLQHIHPSSTIDEIRLEMDFWLSLNASGLRGIELNSNTTMEGFVDILHSCKDELDKLYYLLVTNPNAIH